MKQDWKLLTILIGFNDLCDKYALYVAVPFNVVTVDVLE